MTTSSQTPHLIPSTEILFPNKVPFPGSGGMRLSWVATIQHCAGPHALHKSPQATPVFLASLAVAMPSVPSGGQEAHFCLDTKHLGRSKQGALGPRTHWAAGIFVLFLSGVGWKRSWGACLSSLRQWRHMGTDSELRPRNSPSPRSGDQTSETRAGLHGPGGALQSPADARGDSFLRLPTSGGLRWPWAYCLVPPTSIWCSACASVPEYPFL